MQKVGVGGLALGVVWAGLALGGATGGEPGPVSEFYEVAHVGAARVGTAHTTTARLPDGKTLRTTSDLRLAFRRQGSLVKLRMEQGTDESPDGKVVGVF